MYGDVYSLTVSIYHRMQYALQSLRYEQTDTVARLQKLWSSKNKDLIKIIEGKLHIANPKIFYPICFTWNIHACPLGISKTVL